MKFINFFAPENHYFCVAVDKPTSSEGGIRYANVCMPEYSGLSHWKFNEYPSIGFGGASCKGVSYTKSGSYCNALNELNDISSKSYTSIVQHFMHIYL